MEQEEQLENLKARLEVLYKKDGGEDLRTFATALWGEAGKNFFDHNPESGERFTSANSQRLAFFEIYEDLIDNKYAPDDVFHYTQANND